MPLNVATNMSQPTWSPAVSVRSSPASVSAPAQTPRTMITAQKSSAEGNVQSEVCVGAIRRPVVDAVLPAVPAVLPAVSSSRALRTLLTTQDTAATGALRWRKGAPKELADHVRDGAARAGPAAPNVCPLCADQVISETCQYPVYRGCVGRLRDQRHPCPGCRNPAAREWRPALCILWKKKKKLRTSSGHNCGCGCCCCCGCGLGLRVQGLGLGRPPTMGLGFRV